MTEINPGLFPLGKKKKLKGSRRRAREKALQILFAYKMSGEDWRNIFAHAFYREFNFGDYEERDIKKKEGKLLTPGEIEEIEADIPIKWGQEEINFGLSIIELAIENWEYIDRSIEEIAKNWELDRIAFVDRTLMHIAITELMFFPEIPPKVSINEAIDIAKKYSTDKSGTFINGILDSAYEKLKTSGKIQKEGRGLDER